MSGDEKLFTKHDLWLAWSGGFRAGIDYTLNRPEAGLDFERDLIEAEASAVRYVDAKMRLHTPTKQTMSGRPRTGAKV
jgi:hypothetical protein